LQAQYFFLENKLFLVKNKTETKTLITYRLLANGEQKEVELTEEWVADPNQGRISVTSPLGLALVNKKEGEISEVRTKENSYKIQIISIK
jgi:transcription elongation GreA/GreB family factor